MAKKTQRKKNPPKLPGIPKTPTGIQGLDEITLGGIPTGRPALVCGNAGCGKTLLAMQFLVNGATRFNEPGIFVSFEESPEDLFNNMASLGIDLKKLIRQKKIIIEYVHVDPSEITETGEYDLEGLFIRLGQSIDSIGAKRVALDTLEAIFSAFNNPAILRAELRRLFRWLKDKGVTVVLTGEAGERTLTRQGLEEYVSDSVIVLDHRVTGQISTRRLRVVKFRGSAHGTNEYPFLIGNEGISVLPITSIGLDYEVSNERVSTGVPELDALMGGKGYFRGSNILVSGTAGIGKTSLAAKFVEAALKRGERCLYFAYEESLNQVLRNMRSIGIDLAPWVKNGLLQFHAARPSVHGIEMHLVQMHDFVRQTKPKVVIVDPITSLISIAVENEVASMLTRLIDFLKGLQITSIFTSMTVNTNQDLEHSHAEISSLIDTWLLLHHWDEGSRRKRGLHLLKSRGMAHSEQRHELILSDRGIRISPL